MTLAARPRPTKQAPHAGTARIRLGPPARSASEHGPRPNTVPHLGATRHGGTPQYAVVYADTEYPRDQLGRVVRKDETLFGETRTWEYSYDDLGRLDAVWENGVLTEEYTYDANGNRLALTTPEGTVVGSYDAQDRLMQYGDLAYAYTDNGELSTKLDTVTDEETLYTYDALGNLLSVELPDGTFVEYVVDGRSRSIARKVDGVVTAAVAVQGSAQSGRAARRRRQPRVAVRLREQAPRAGLRDPRERWRGVSDRLATSSGSVVLVVNVADASDVLLAARYSAFGEQEVIAGSGDAVPFGFAGGINDSTTGLTRFGARDYDALTGRWVSKDPARFIDGANLYIYAGSDPINKVDSNGLSTCDICKGLAHTLCSQFCAFYYPFGGTYGPWGGYLKCYASCRASQDCSPWCPPPPPPPKPPTPPPPPPASVCPSP